MNENFVSELFITEKDWELFANEIDISPKIVKSELERQKNLIIKLLKEVISEQDGEIGNKILDYVQTKI